MLVLNIRKNNKVPTTVIILEVNNSSLSVVVILVNMAYMSKPIKVQGADFGFGLCGSSGDVSVVHEFEIELFYDCSIISHFLVCINVCNNAILYV